MLLLRLPSVNTPLILDTHCHLLPGLDDGPRTEDEAVELAVGLARHGVRQVLCTPHYSRRYPTRHNAALDAAGALRRRLDQEQVRLGLEVAAEISPLCAMRASAVELRVRGIGRRFALVELEASTAVPVIGALCNRLSMFGLLPILAHPERCAGIGRSLDSLDDARARGALVQVVATSLLGRWGDAVAETAWRILATDRADLLASDAHSKRSAPALEVASGLVAERLGKDVARALTVENPAQIVQGRSPAQR